jgi:CRISPR-associated endonuclease/helicase Cas3
MIASIYIDASQDLKTEREPCLELHFPVTGKCMPADHGYGLYAAFIHLIPELRQETRLSILTISGFRDRQGKIFLTEQSHFKMRVPISKIPLIYQLAGKQVSVGVHQIQIGIPEISVIRPAEIVRARIVTIKGYTEPKSFQLSAQRQLDNLGIKGEVSVSVDREGNPIRKTIKVKQYTIVGFTTEVSGLNEEDSLNLQQCGLGGKRKMGAGYFLPYVRS